MALTITKKCDAKLGLDGTSLELDSVYARLEMVLRPDGKSVATTLYLYDAKASYTAGKSRVKINAINKDGEGNDTSKELQTFYMVSLDEGKAQSLGDIHDAVKTLVAADGYTVAKKDL